MLGTSQIVAEVDLQIMHALDFLTLAYSTLHMPAENLINVALCPCEFILSSGGAIGEVALIGRKARCSSCAASEVIRYDHAPRNGIRATIYLVQVEPPRQQIAEPQQHYWTWIWILAWIWPLVWLWPRVQV